MNNRALIGLSAAAMSALVATAVGCGEPQQKTYTPAEEPAATVEAPATTEAETTETEAAEPEATEAEKTEETTEAEKTEQAAPAEETKTDEKAEPAADKKAEEPAAEEAKSDDKAEQAAPAAEAGALTDGSYTAEGKGIGGAVPVTVEVKDGKIATVTVGDNSETQGIGSKAIEQLPEAIVAADGTEGVDAVSGATVTSKAIFTAVDEALEQAKGGAAAEQAEQAAPAADDSKAEDKAEPAVDEKAEDAKADEKAEPAADEKAEQAAPAAEAGALTDGSYTAEGKGIGGAVPVTVEVKDGKIATVTVGDNSETQGIGSKAIEQLPDAIVKANGTEGVDAVSGATVTSKAIFTAVDEALEQAKGGAAAEQAAPAADDKAAKDDKAVDAKADEKKADDKDAKADEKAEPAAEETKADEKADKADDAKADEKAEPAAEEAKSDDKAEADDKAAKDDKAADTKDAKANDKADAAAALTDGEYTAEGKGIGGKVPVTVTVKDGKVSEVKVGDNSETQGIGSKAIEQLPDAIVKANGTEGVDAVSGATVTSKAIFTAVDEALEQAKGGAAAEQAAPAADDKADEKAAPAAEEKADEKADAKDEKAADTEDAKADDKAADAKADEKADKAEDAKADEKKADDKAAKDDKAADTKDAKADDKADAAAALTDGEYTAEGKGIGGKVPVTVTVKDGKVSEVTVGDNSETQGIGTKAIEQLPDAIVKANGTEGVDAVSGATVTSKAIFSAVEDCLKQAAPAADDKAAKDDKAADAKADKAEAGALKDGEYTAEGKGIGGKVPVTVTVKDGKVSEVKVGDNSETQGIGTKAIEQLPAKIVEANGTEGVDAVSGATVTSKAIFTAVEDCLKQAK